MMLRRPRATLFPYTTLFRSGGGGPNGRRLVTTRRWLRRGAVRGPGSGLLVLRGARRSDRPAGGAGDAWISLRSEEHTSELRHTVSSYAVFCLKKKIRSLCSL